MAYLVFEIIQKVMASFKGKNCSQRERRRCFYCLTCECRLSPDIVWGITDKHSSTFFTPPSSRPSSSWWYKISFRPVLFLLSLQKHAYSNILRILPQKNENVQIKNSGSFHISVENIDCGYSLEWFWWVCTMYNLCFWAEMKKIMYTPENPSFIVQKWSLRGSKLYRYVFVMELCFKIFHCHNNASKWVGPHVLRKFITVLTNQYQIWPW